VSKGVPYERVFDPKTDKLVAAVQRDGGDEGQHLYETPDGSLYLYSFTPALKWEFDDQGPTYQTYGVSEEITPVSADAPVVQALLRHVAKTAASTRVPLLP
jgi:hypothetical protein